MASLTVRAFAQKSRYWLLAAMSLSAAMSCAIAAAVPLGFVKASIMRATPYSLRELGRLKNAHQGILRVYCLLVKAADGLAQITRQVSHETPVFNNVRTTLPR